MSAQFRLDLIQLLVGFKREAEVEPALRRLHMRTEWVAPVVGPTIHAPDSRESAAAVQRFPPGRAPFLVAFGLRR